MKLILGPDYPQAPPRGFFLTKIFHPNVSTNGDICVNTLKKDWNDGLTLSHTLSVIRCLLIVPFPESSLNDEAGKLFMDSYEVYAERARMMTRVHAIPRGLVGALSSGSSHCQKQPKYSMSKAAKDHKKEKSLQRARQSPPLSQSFPSSPPLSSTLLSSSSSSLSSVPLSMKRNASPTAIHSSPITPSKISSKTSKAYHGTEAAELCGTSTVASHAAIKTGLTKHASTFALSDKSNSKKSPTKSPVSSGKRERLKKRRLSRL